MILNKQDFGNLMHTVTEGKIAQKKIYEYLDHLISCNNPEQVGEWVRPTKYPCRNNFKTEVSDLDSGYLDMVNSVQRRSKCNYLREDDKGNQYCRFHYLFPLRR